MLLHPNPVHASRLHWQPERRMYVAEISDLGGFGRVWDDAADEGLTLISRHDGHEVVFVVTKTARDHDGDITHWVLEPARPGTATVTLKIFND